MLANGPSLRDFTISEFDPASTIGMNSAFRLWRVINWQPLFYVSADPVVTAQNAEAVTSLISNAKIELAILNRTFLDTPGEHSPSSLGIKSLVAIGDTSLLDMRYFTGGYRSFSTTGSISIRLAAALGAETISLYGFDLSYSDWRQKRVSLASITRKRSDSASKDYFFDGYQTPGDAFQTPNPWFLPFDLHTFAVKKAIARVRRLNPSIKIYQFGSSSLVDIVDKKAGHD